MGAERRAAEPSARSCPVCAGAAGALEQTAARHAELPGDVPGDELGLIEPLAVARRRRSAPR